MEEPFQTCRSRMKYLKDLCNNIHNEQRNEQRLDHIEYSLFQKGCKTNKKVCKTKEIE